MKKLKKILVGLCVAVAFGAAPVAANAEVKADVADSNQVTATVQSTSVASTPDSSRLPVTPVEGDNSADNQVSNASIKFNWTVLVAFAAADFFILTVAYNYETKRDKLNTFAQHYNGRYVAR